MTVAVDRSGDPYQRLLHVTRRAEQLRAQAAALVERSRMLCLRGAALRDATPRDAACGVVANLPSPPLLGFQLEGWLGDRRVSARFEHDQLTVDDHLATQAMLLVDLQEVFQVDDRGRSVAATLEGPPQAVFVTLVRACERVTDASFVLPLC